MKESELEVLNHLLQGIMDCTDMMNLFCLLKKKGLCKYQNRRMPILMKAFQQISQLYVLQYQEIPTVATTFQRIFDSSAVTAESTDLIDKVLQDWMNWELKGIDLYTKMLEEQPKIQLWKKLLITSKLCLMKNAKYRKNNQYTPLNNAKAVATNNGSTDIRQRMQERLAATQK